ncbi:MAG: RNA-binding transcriptional accessory protein [Desulfobacterales bacterium]|nr:RNA-binding transcriptional accessory protein [Desulfobacterales bacterium]
MNNAHITRITSETGYHAAQVTAVAALLLEGATIPFISRYRKEVTGSLDEVAVTTIRDRLSQMAELDSRREAVLKSLDQHGHLNDELRDRVQAAETLSELEDIYLPYRPKRRTKATMAREKGLEPLAEALFSQSGADPEKIAASFVDPEKGVDSVDDALAGARDIMAEWVSENAQARAALRRLFENRGVFRCTVATGKEAEAAKYKDYFDWQEPVATAPSHRILAMRRGEKEDLLNLTIAPAEEEAVTLLQEMFLTGDGPDTDQVRLAVTDSYKRLLSRSMETEIRLTTKERADTEAIRVFADNLRQLLLAPPLGAKRIMAIDPGFRTGCKLVCLDRQGKLLHNGTIYPHTSSGSDNRAAETVRDLADRYDIEAVAVGNGTAGRETETFLRAIDFSRPIPIVMVNESGASIYSASEAARKEFPDHDLTVRGSISIGRRLMDPLSELVKIDPKSIGVGQYQHDVDPIALKQSLDDVVASCVNGVGVDVNRASVQLLTYVSGLGPRLAANIVAFRDENGPFESRLALKQVPRLGPKAFEQAAGFLRIHNGPHPLDASAVHPESYHIVDAMAADLSCTVGELMTSAEQRKKIEPNRYVTDTVGLPTLRDILAELAKPGRDPRKEFEAFSFASGIEKPADLREGMRLPGIVTNITAFGAFVDIGVHQDGLVHVSQMADRFVRNPSDVVKVAQKVDVTVLEVDLERKRISLSMKSAPETGGRGAPAAAKKNSGKKKQQAPAASKPTPFNNPFADAFGKKH